MRLTSHSRIGASADCLANDRSTQSTVMTPASPTFFQGRPSTSASNCVRLSVAVVAVVAVASVLFRVAQVLASYSCVYNFIEEAGTKVLASQLFWDC